MKIPPSLSREHVLRALADLEAGTTHRFGDSRKYDLLFLGKRYSPKAVLGLAIKHLTGAEPSPRDFGGGDTTNRPLRDLGFEVVQKT